MRIKCSFSSIADKWGQENEKQRERGDENKRHVLFCYGWREKESVENVNIALPQYKRQLKNLTKRKSHTHMRSKLMALANIHTNHDDDNDDKCVISCECASENSHTHAQR